MDAKTDIFLVRHGETEWNVQKRLQGNLDSPLTSNGIDQACRTKQLLDGCKVDQAYVSPLKRARDTLDIILGERKIQGVVEDDLREMGLGPWEGRTRNETALSHPDQYREFWENPDAFFIQGAETFHELQHRMVNSLESIFLKGKNKTILAVSHWIAIKTALAHYMSVPLSRLPEIANPENGGLLRLSRQGEGTLIHRQIEGAWTPVSISS